MIPSGLMLRWIKMHQPSLYMYKEYWQANWQCFLQQYISANRKQRPLLTSSIFLAQVRESPHVPQAYREAHLCQDVLQFAVPCWTSIVFRDLDLRDFLPGASSYIQRAVFVVQRLLVCEQVSHRLCDMFMRRLTLRHLAVLPHQGCWR